MVFICGEEIENIIEFFVKHFVSNEDYINYHSSTWYVSARVLFFTSQYFIEVAIAWENQLKWEDMKVKVSQYKTGLKNRLVARPP